MGDVYQDFKCVKEPHSPFVEIIKDNQNLSEASRTSLQILRSDIYSILNGKKDVRMSIFVHGENDGRPYKYKIGNGKKHLIVNICPNEIRFAYDIDDPAFPFLSHIWKLVVGGSRKINEGVEVVNASHNVYQLGARSANIVASYLENRIATDNKTPLPSYTSPTSNTATLPPCIRTTGNIVPLPSYKSPISTTAQLPPYLSNKEPVSPYMRTYGNINTL